MGRRARAWARLLCGALVLLVLVLRLGGEPFLDGVRALGPGTLLAAAAINAGTTLCCAQRWRVVAHGLGIGLPLPAAAAAYYRSQLLNGVLPGGVLGDLHRGVRHGTDAGDLGRGLRAVVWERAAGQAVQVLLSVVALLVLPSPVHAAMPVVAIAAVAVLGVGALAGRRLKHRAGRPAVLLRAAAEEARAALFPAGLPVVGLASVLVVLGHVGTFLLAARAAGATASPVRLLPLALLVLLAAAVPLNVGGWGPREGIAAWAFAAAGLGAHQGVAVATAFGVLSLVATLPGAAVLAAGWLRPRATRSAVPAPLPVEPAAAGGRRG